MSSGYLCSYCNLYFLTKGNLNKHMQTDKHKRKGNRVNYYCSQCLYTTSHKSKFELHINSLKHKYHKYSVDLQTFRKQQKQWRTAKRSYERLQKTIQRAKQISKNSAISFIIRDNKYKWLMNFAPNLLNEETLQFNSISYTYGHSVLQTLWDCIHLCNRFMVQTVFKKIVLQYKHLSKLV